MPLPLRRILLWRRHGRQMQFKSSLPLPLRTNLQEPIFPPPLKLIPTPKAIHTEYKKTELTSRGAKFFWTFFVLLLPLIGLAFLAFFGIFALCVLSVCALIVICFMVLAAAVIAGSIICLVSLIYGIIQMFASLGIGLYEVGLGIVASGLTVLVSVLVYLVGTRVLPYLLKQLLAFTGHTLGQLPGIWDRAREECNKL